MNFHKPHVFFTYSEIDLSIYISLAPLHTITSGSKYTQRLSVDRKVIDSGGRLAEFWELNEVKCFDLETDTKQLRPTVAPRAVHNNGSVQPCRGSTAPCLPSSDVFTRAVELFQLFDYVSDLQLKTPRNWK